MSDNSICDCHGNQSLCSWLPKVRETLLKYFNFADFRPGQSEASIAILHGQDVFVRMATGSGKSLCMFLGPLTKSNEAVAVIISPLNGLMEQQVKLLRDCGITAVHICSNISLFQSVCQGDYRFVFVSPELAVRPPWRRMFTSQYFKKNLALVAVDEAHCIPEWGSDFRTAFNNVGGLRALTTAPFMALSASAPLSVAKAIVESLHLKSPVVISHSLDRPNIFFSYSKSKGLPRDLAGLCDALSKQTHEIPKTIVFCRTKNDCSKVYCHLVKAAADKRSVSMYHSSLTQSTKARLYDDFKSDTHLRCLSATIAFGMGMDIADVEVVVVHGLPDTVSQLYQLCGRAGRSGCQARAHVLFMGAEEKIKDPTLKLLCSDKENCFRATMLTSLGGNVTDQNPLCCINCNPSAFSDGGRLDVTQVGKTPPMKKRRVAVRKLNDSETTAIQVQLKAERAKFMAEHPSFKILGAQLVCSDSVINSICDSSKFISLLSDMDVFCVRQELKERFYNVILAVVNS